MIETATGLILRVRPLTDTSLIIHWLTSTCGRIATVAKGARQAKSAFAGKLDLFYLADFSFQRSRRSELHLLREVKLLNPNAEIRRELGYLQQASYAAKLIEVTTEEQTPLPEICELAQAWLAQLTKQPPLPQILFAFEFRLLEHLGLAPDLESSSQPPDVLKLADVLSTSDWPLLGRLKLSPKQISQIRSFLHQCETAHVGPNFKLRYATLPGEE